jgi:hypothetical protein
MWPYHSRKYGRQRAPVFEGFEGFEGFVEVRFMVVVVEVRGVAGGEILAWGLEIQVFRGWGDGWG